jgi:asparagine synthase (glutamine-hydrolysing)
VSVPPGSRMCLRPGQRPTITSAVHVPRRSRPEAAAALRSALDTGVGTWIRSAKRPGTDISGLDSGAVCMLAARHVRPPARLTAVTVHPAGRDDGADLSCARRALRQDASAEHVLLPLGPEHLPGTALGQIPATDEPPPSAFTWTRLAAEFALLARLGIDCHLTGDGGDTLFYPGPGYLSGLARSGRWLRLAAHAQGWARLQNTSPWPVLDRAVRAGNEHVRPPWVTDLASEMASHDPRRNADEGQRTLLEIQSVGRSARADAQLAETFGIMLRNPYTGSAVIDAALSVPAWERGDPWHYKPLLTDALSGMLPPVIADRTTKGAFDAEHHRGMRANLAAVLGLADGHLAALGLIDPYRFRAAVRNAAAGLPAPFGLLEPALAAEAWLQVITSAPRPAWSRSEPAAAAAQEQS